MEDLVNKLKRIKANTASGVDQIKKLHLKQKGALHVLSKFYNLLILSRVYLFRWRINRTTLIPKPGKNADKIRNWSPITIGSLLKRMYSEMIYPMVLSPIVCKLKEYSI